MKKASFLIMSVVILTSTIYGQAGMKINGNPPAYNPARELEITCPQNSLYGQEPDINNAWNSSVYDGTRSYDIPVITGQISVARVTFWGADFSVIPTRKFEVAFYTDNSGLPGTLIGKDTATLTGVLSGIAIFDVYPSLKWTMDLVAPITINPGDWISVYCYDNYSTWFWENSPDGDGFIYMYPYGLNNVNVSYCLESSEVPISNWALFIGIGLILVFAVVRFRKVI